MKTKNKNCFTIQETMHRTHDGIQLDLVSVWLGPPNDPESDRVLTVGREYLPQLIAKLRGVPTRRSKLPVRDRHSDFAQQGVVGTFSD
jgi:hypothetical protein